MDFGAKMFTHVGLTGPTEAVAQIRIDDQALQACREGIDIVGVEKQAVHFVGDERCHWRDSGGDDRYSPGHRLLPNETETLEHRWEHKDIEEGVDRVDVVTVSEDADIYGKACRRHFVGETGRVKSNESRQRACTVIRAAKWTRRIRGRRRFMS